MNAEGLLPALSWAIMAAWGLGCLLLAALSLNPSWRERIRPLWYLMASELVIIGIGVAPWHLPASLLGLVLVAGAARIGYEAGHVYGLAAGRRFSAPFAIALAGATALAWFAIPLHWLWWLGPGAGVAACLYLLPTRDWVKSAPARFVLYPALPFLAFAAAGRAGSAALMVLAFLFVELFDSFSLLGGKLFGKTLLVPRLSPRKTWEGLATGCAALALSCVALAAYLGTSFPRLLLLAVVAAAAALAGDLTASAIKRRAGVKDYPAVLPVQGGLLDIIDAWIVAAPLVAIAGWSLGI